MNRYIEHSTWHLDHLPAQQLTTPAGAVTVHIDAADLRDTRTGQVLPDGSYRVRIDGAVSLMRTFHGEHRVSHITTYLQGLS